MFKWTSGSALLVAVCLPAAALGDDVKLDFVKPLPLSLENAPNLFHQCSRAAPEPEDPLWLPSGQEIALLEERLAAYAEAEPDQFRAFRRPGLMRVRGQYAGFTRGKTRFIYASYFPANTIDFARKTFNGEVLIVCDGGAAFWGVVYDVEAGTFSDLRFNDTR